MDRLTALWTVLGAATTGGLAYLKTRHGKAKVISYVKRLLNLDLTSEDLKNSLENMSTVVDTQGQSIQWLTTQQDWLTAQIAIYKEELAEAKEQLKEMENLHIENKGLKSRISELESQVKALEDELARRKKYTPKDKRGE